MSAEVLRNALIQLYGSSGYITKFARRIGRKRQTVHSWLRGDYEVPTMAMLIVTLLLREKRSKETK